MRWYRWDQRRSRHTSRGDKLTAHVALDQSVPRVRAEVGVLIDASHAVVIRDVRGAPIP
jgi:hypothetical protein